MLSWCSRTSERYHLARVRLDLGAVLRPRIHQLAALVEQIGAAVCLLHTRADRVRERQLGYLPRERVRSAAQSRKVERNPCTVIFSRPCRASAIAIALG